MEIGFGAHDEAYEVTEVGFQLASGCHRRSSGPGKWATWLAAVKEVAIPAWATRSWTRPTPPELLAGYQEVRPMVFAGLYPTSADDYEELREALDRLRLNDAALHYEPETSAALGFGFRCGFLGLLHMEIVQERLEREFGVELITTVPNVEYHVKLTNGESLRVETPTRLPERGRIERSRSPS
jgi:GTP-binding protein LepA